MTVFEYLKQRKGCTHLAVELRNFITDGTTFFGSYGCAIEAFNSDEYKSLGNAVCMHTSDLEICTDGRLIIYYIRPLNQYSDEDLARAATVLHRHKTEKAGI